MVLHFALFQLRLQSVRRGSVGRVAKKRVTSLLCHQSTVSQSLFFLSAWLVRCASSDLQFGRVRCHFVAASTVSLVLS